jgi:hypothetical protein
MSCEVLMMFRELMDKQVYKRHVKNFQHNNKRDEATGLHNEELHKKNFVPSVRKWTIPTERPPLVSEVSANFFADRGCHVASMMDPYGGIVGFLDRTHYFFLSVAPQLYSRGWVDPVPDPLLFFFL